MRLIFSIWALSFLFLVTVAHSADVSEDDLDPDRPIELQRKHPVKNRRRAVPTTTRSRIRSTTRKHFSMKLGPGSFMSDFDMDEKYDDSDSDTSLPGRPSTLSKNLKAVVKTVNLPLQKKPVVPVTFSPVFGKNAKAAILSNNKNEFDDDDDDVKTLPQNIPSSPKAFSANSLPSLRAVLTITDSDLGGSTDQNFGNAIASVSGAQVNQVSQQLPPFANLNGFRPVPPPAIPDAATMPLMAAAVPLPPSPPTIISNTTAGPPVVTTLPGFLVGSPYPFVMGPPDIPYFGSKWNGPWGYPIGHYQAFRGTGQYSTHYQYYPTSYYSSLLAPFAYGVSG